MLKYKFLFPLLILVTFSIFSVGALTFFRTSKELQKAALLDMQRSAFLLKNSSEAWIKNRFDDIKELAQSDIFVQSTGDSFLSKASRQVASKRMTEIVANSPFYYRLLLVNREGIILASSGYAEDEVLSDEYRKFLGDAWSKTATPGEAGSTSGWHNEDYHYIVGVRLFREDKINLTNEPLDGMIIADVSAQALIDTTFSQVSFGRSGYASLFDETRHKIDKNRRENLLSLITTAAVSGRPADDVYFINNNGGENVLVTKQLDLVPWTLGVTINKSEFTEPAYRVAYEIVIIGLIITALTGALIMAFLNWVLKPIQSLASTAEAVTRQKDYSLRAEKFSNDELGMLVISFNDMLKQIETRDHELEESAHKLEKARDAADEARVKAEVANQAKTEFLANMSHELRTPLNSIIGLTDILIEEKMAAEQHEMVGIVKRSSSNLLEIVNDILELSKIENLGLGLVLEAVAFDLNHSILEIEEVLAPLASQKGIALRHHFSSRIPYVIGDQFRVKRILMNLISNAIKYTVKGSVDVQIEPLMLPDGRVEVTVGVRDTGIGIPEEKFDAIFEKFTQADESTTRKFGGTGLGLTIARNLVERMGGKITVASKVGVGSVFTFCVPFRVADKLEEAEAKADHGPAHYEENRVPFEKARILVAEDSELNKVYIRKLLSALGAPQPPDLASDGQEALEMWRKNPYDIILMDCHMPVLSGYDAVTHIRKEESATSRTHTPVIAMTADVLSGTRDKCIKAGMDDYISKPVDKQKFVALLSRWIEFGRKDQPSGKQAEAAEETPPLDLAHVREFGGGDVLAEREFVQVFLQESEKSLAILKDNRTDGKNQVWSETMHYLKSSFGLIGAESVRQLCEKGQHQKEATAEERIALYDDIMLAYDGVKSFLQKVYPV